MQVFSLGRPASGLYSNGWLVTALLLSAATPAYAYPPFQGQTPDHVLTGLLSRPGQTQTTMRGFPPMTGPVAIAGAEPVPLTAHLAGFALAQLAIALMSCWWT